jgi:hypothetical protein
MSGTASPTRARSPARSPGASRSRSPGGAPASPRAPSRGRRAPSTAPRPRAACAVDPLAREVALLEAQRQAAIGACDFSRVRAIDAHLDRLRDDLAFARKSAGRVEGQFVLDLKREALRVRAAAALQEAREAVFALQAAFQGRLIELHEAHGRALAAFSEQYAAALELELTRIVPDAIQLKRQAQFNARNRDYGIAEALFEESTERQRGQLAKKQEEVKQLFETKRERIECRYQKVVEACRKKQIHDIEGIQQRFDAEIARYRANLVRTASDQGISLADDELAFLDDFRLKDQIRSPSRAQQKASASGSVGSRPSTPISASRYTPPHSPSLI